MTKQKKIIETYLSGKYDSEVTGDFAHWFDSPIECTEKQEAMKSLWDSMEVPECQSTDAAFRAVQSSLTQQSKKNRHRSRSRKKLIHSLRTAAIFVLPLMASGLTFLLTRENTQKVQWEEVYCPYGQTKTVALADGSKIKLNAGSRLVYPSSFDADVRKVFLTGEAYADIAKDPQKKFVVSGNDLDIIVHGTQFNVRSYPEDSEIEVMLIDGSIDMKTKTLSHNRTISMSPGDLVRLDHKTGTVKIENVPTESFMTDARLTFVNRRLADITSQLERVFNVHIIIDNHIIENQRYLASFVNGESLDEILRLLRRTGHFKYSITDDNKQTIYIH